VIDMGMFDDVVFEQAPIKCKCGAEVKYFQTKDFENLLDCYRVNIHGQLERETYQFRAPRPDEIRKIGDVTLPLTVKESTGWHSLKKTCTLYVYTYCNQCGKYWFEIELEYFRGKLMSTKISKRKL